MKLLRLACWLVLACLLQGGSAWAGALDLAAVQDSITADPHMALLEDRPAILTPQEALAAGGWIPATPANLVRGTTASALWLRIPVTNQGTAAVVRWVVVGSPRLERVDMSLFDESAALLSTQQAGTGRALRLREVPDRFPVFPVELQPGETATVLVRVESRTTVSIQVDVWTPMAFRQARLSRDAGVLVPVAAVLTAALSVLLLAVARRRPTMVLLAASLTTTAVYELAYHGFVYRYLLPGGVDLAVRAPAILGLLMSLLSAAFLHVFLRLGELRVCRWVLPAFGLVFSVLLLISLAGDLSGVLAASNVLLMVFLPAVWICIAVAWWHRRPYADVLLLALSALIFFLRVRVLAISGLQPEQSFPVEPFVFYVLCVTVVLLLIDSVMRDARDRERLADEARDALLQKHEVDRLRLEEAVRERTLTLRRALTRAHSASRDKSEFLARVSHDLRSPLTAIIGYAEMIVAAGRRDAQSGRVIRRSARHVLGMLNDVIDYAQSGGRGGALQVAPLYTSALIDSVAGVGRDMARQSGHAFELKLGSQLPLVIEADGKRLSQVIESVLSEVAESAREGGVRLVVEVQARDGASSAGHALFVFTVREIAAPAHRLPADAPDGRRGLAQRAAKQWLERMGGRMERSSLSGGGTAVRVRVPLAVSGEAALPSTAWAEDESVLPALDGSGLGIWLAEDAPEIRLMLATELEGLGFEVTSFDDGGALIERAGAAVEAPSLVLTDLQMPHADGRAVLATVWAQWPQVPVVLLTATTLDHDAQDLRGFAAVLQKPVSLSQLRHTVGGLLGLAPRAAE